MSRQKEPTYITEKKPFPKRLRKLLKDTNTTQSALAESIGVTRQTISQYANGQNTPDIETFVRIADYFGVSYDYLLGYSQSEKREHHSAVEQTGLSGKAVEILKTWVEGVNETDATVSSLRVP